MEPENRRFLELMEAAGWTQAETARRLHMSSGGVNQIVKGGVRPSAQTLALLARVVADEVPATVAARAGEIAPEARFGHLRESPLPYGPTPPGPPEVERLADQLRDLHARNPEGYRVVAGVIKQFSSSPRAARTRVVKSVASKVQRAAPAPLPKQKAGGRSGEK